MVCGRLELGFVENDGKQGERLGVGSLRKTTINLAFEVFGGLWP